MTGRLSLRARATLVGTALAAALLTIGAVLLVSTLESRLTDASDQLSRSRVADLLALAGNGDLPSVLSNVGENGVAQVVSADGEVVAASPNIAGRAAVAELTAGPTPRTKTFRAPDDAEVETYRFWYASGPSPDGPATVYVGNSLESVSEASAALRHSLWVGVPCAIAVLALIIWLLLGRALGRLDRIRAEVDRISAENLDRRVAGDGIDDEVGRLAATMNAMLGRLDAAARRQRDFVADVSHDLQSPLASQRVALELALLDPAHVDVSELGSEVLADTDTMERLVQDLLVLASVDDGAPPASTLLDLDELVLEEAVRARLGASVTIDTSAVSGAPAYAPADDVRRIVRNLLDNAVAHASTCVRLRVDVDGPWARLDVVDDGPGVPVEHRERVFDRFHRVEVARPHGSGSGLGLAIARSLAERAGGRVDLLDSPGGAHFRVLLPTARPE